MERAAAPTRKLAEQEPLVTPCSEEQALDRGRHCATRAAAVGAIAAAVACALAAFSFHRSPARQIRGAQPVSDTLVDAPSSTPYLTQESGFGCMNYQSIAMGEPTHGESSESCGHRCSATVGCVGFGFQARADCAGQGTGHDGSCYLWSGKCVFAPNSCWDQFGPASESFAALVSSHQANTSITAEAKLRFDEEPGIGCANWEDIKLGEPSLHAESVEDCDRLCRNTTGCVGFGFKANASCDNHHGNDHDGVCLLWNNSCKREVNPCWDQNGPSHSHQIMTEKEPGIGCANYADIAIRRVAVDSAEGCDRLCHNTSGCIGFGFQPTADCDGDGSGIDNACLLWKNGCERQVNHCWDLYGLASSRLAHKESGMGCANYADIAIGEPSHVESVEDCDRLCIETLGCVGFGFQAWATCDGEGTGTDNACYLWKGECVRRADPCWDHYGEVSQDEPITTTTNMHHQVSLYCWMIFKLQTYEVDLVENQFKRQMGIFNRECNGNALITDGEFHMEAEGRKYEAINMGPGSMECDKGSGGSHSNTGIFKRAWKTIFDQHRYQLYDWVIKVDADTVFRPLRFKWHVDHNHLGLNPDERIYFKNFMEKYTVIGAIEVASREVVAAMEQDQSEKGCNGIYLPAEDDWFHRCMEHHGARMVHDATLLQHEDFPEGPNRCADQWFVALHPYKDVWAMNVCDDAVR